MYLLRYFVLIILLCAPLSTLLAGQAAPDVLLAKIYESGTKVEQFLVSEKYDGVRAIWDGKTLKTRQGNTINAPIWFTKDLPKMALDGELWLSRGQFDNVSSAARKSVPIDDEWRNISYLIFELPNAEGTFEARVKRIVEIVAQAKIAHLKAVVQFRVKNEADLKKRLKQVVANGGEGLMLHRADALYSTGRSDNLLKLKPYFDAEAKVIAYTAGRGKHKGKLGALIVETPAGIRFKLGSGFSDTQRENPPKIGSTVTYTYKDKTPKGKPKFASFLRERKDI